MSKLKSWLEQLYIDRYDLALIILTVIIYDVVQYYTTYLRHL